MTYLLLICLQIAGIQCIILVRPKDEVAEVGGSVSFSCGINALSSSSSSFSSTRRGIRWIYTTEMNFRSPKHIYARGSVSPQWRARHNVTETMDGLFTLTISPVNATDVGFYTCMDQLDDSKATAELTLAAEIESHSTTIGKGVTHNTLKQSKQENEQTSEISKQRLGDEATGMDIFPIALFVSCVCAALICLLVLAMIAVFLWLRSSRRRKVSTVNHSSEESSCKTRSPSEQQTLEDVNDYEMIPDQKDLKEQPLHLSGSKDNRYNRTLYANDNPAVYVALSKREPVVADQPPVYASLNFDIGQNQSQRSLLTGCCQKS